MTIAALFFRFLGGHGVENLSVMGSALPLHSNGCAQVWSHGAAVSPESWRGPKERLQMVTWGSGLPWAGTASRLPAVPLLAHR